MIRMTWPQYRRQEIEVRGQVIRLSKSQAEIAFALLVRPGVVSFNDLIEAVWPDPDFEPDYARNILSIQIHKMRRKGIPVVNYHSRGYSL